MGGQSSASCRMTRAAWGLTKRCHQRRALARFYGGSSSRIAEEGSSSAMVEQNFEPQRAPLISYHRPVSSTMRVKKRA